MNFPVYPYISLLKSTSILENVKIPLNQIKSFFSQDSALVTKPILLYLIIL